MADAKIVSISNQNSGAIDSESSSKNIIYIEPLGKINADGSVTPQPVDNKELLIYVDLTAGKKKRSIIQITDEQNKTKSINTSEAEINLIGYRYDRVKKEKYMTTDWTNKPNFNKNVVIGTSTDLSSGSEIFEGFGVESIDINVTAMNPPSVKIKFVDIRGGGLFDQETFNTTGNFENSTSPYSIFFELPPPLFYLTIKGYYGNPATLCLYLIKWQGNFNSENGNFEINADFLGYTFAFLQDIKIGHLIGVGNTNEGKKKLIEVSNNPTAEGKTFPPITIDELAVRFQRITIKRKELQKDSEMFQKLKVINEQISITKNLRSIIGYTSALLPPNAIKGAFVKTDLLKPNTQQIFFRDVGLFPKTSTDDQQGTVESKFKELSTLVDDLLKKYADLKNGYPEDFYDGAMITQTELQFPATLESLNNTKINLNDALNEVNRLILENEPNGKIPKITAEDFSASTKNNWPSNSGFYVANLKNSRDVVTNKIKILIDAKTKQEEFIGKEFNKIIIDILGFNPTISNIIGILCNNTEMFLDRIYDTGLLAENKNDLRVQLLSGYENDSPENQKGKIYPFPKIVDKDLKETYIGNIPGATGDIFPEIDFLEGICDGLVQAIKQATELNQALNNVKSYTNVTSFPINANDVGIKPYISIDYLPSDQNGAINSDVAQVIIRRAFISYVYSKYRTESFFKIAEFEAINFYDTIENDIFRDSFKELSDNQTNENSILQIALKKDIVRENDNNTYKFSISDIYEKSFEIDKKSLQETNKLWNVDINLKEDIKFNNETDSPKFKSPKQSETYVKRFYDENLTYLNKSYFTLGTFKYDGIKNSILDGRSMDLSNLLETSTFEKFLTTNASNDGGKYFYVKRTATNSQENIPITKSYIYFSANTIGTGNTSVNQYAQAYVLLGSFLFGDDSILENEINPNDYTKIIRLPYMYILWLGANSYRLNKENEILPFNRDFSTTPKNFFYYPTENKSIKINNPTLINLFQSEFENWVRGNEFKTFNLSLVQLLNSEKLTPEEQKILIDEINKIVLKEIDLIVYDTNWTISGSTAKIETIPVESLTSYLNRFMTSYYEIYKNKSGKNTTKKEEPQRTDRVVTDKDIQYSFYIDLKHIYDNWIAGNKNSSTYSCCKTISQNTNNNKVTKQKLYDLFKFVDKFRNETAGDAIININSFNDLVNKKDTGLYSFISKVLTDSYFMHFNLPFYTDFNDLESAKKIFEPQTVVDNTNIKSTPTLLCVYNGPPSTNLKSSSNYGNDGLDIKSNSPIPKSVFDQKEGQKNTSLLAFNINYGSQTQSIFKNISVGTQESKVTGEYMTTLSNYVLGTGESKPILKDNSMFPVMRSRSYTSTIQMLGDMMIQPQMYFQLNNIPFFSGAYMIMNVSHQLRANNMMTTFKGVRQNRSPVTIITEPVSFLKFQFDQGIYSGTTISIQPNVDLVAQAQSENKTPVVENKTVSDYKPIVGTTLIKSYDATFNHLGADIKVNDATTQIVSANKAGTVLINVLGTETVAGLTIILHEQDVDGYWYYTGYFGIKNNTLQTGAQVIAKTNIGLPSSYTKNVKKEGEIQPTQPNAVRPNYTFEIETDKYNDGTIAGFTAKIYNNGKYIGKQSYSNTFGSNEVDNNGRPITQIDYIKKDLEYDAQRGFCGDSFISADSQETFGARTTGTCYPGYREFDEKQNQQIIPPSEKDETIYYYHYEIARSKTLINTYDEYLKSPNIEKLDPQQFAPELKVEIESEAVHNYDIYKPESKKVEEKKEEEISPIIGEYSNDVLTVSINPASPLPWKISTMKIVYQTTSICAGNSSKNLDDNYVSSNGQTATLTKQNIINEINCLSEPLEEQIGTYDISVEVWAWPYNPDGTSGLTVDRRQKLKRFKFSFTV